MLEAHHILLVDDHTIFRSGLGKLLAETQTFQIGGEAGSIDEALNALRHQPELNIVILDVNLGGENALERIPDLRNVDPDIPILVMSMYPPDQFAPAAYRAGANGYLSKDASPEQLFSALEKVARGEKYQNPELKNGTNTDAPGYPHERLSDRELDILKLMANGDSLTDIGQKMFLSVKTVSTYRTRILEKLDLTNNAELVKYALTHGLSL